jgi:hypothetical protein
VYEAKHQPLLPRPGFYRRIALHASAALGLLVLSLCAGMLGYVVTEHMPWVDAFLNTAMLLGGMGPVNPPMTTGGKLFAGVFALYAGMVFVVSAALVLTPVVHRALHHFHVSDKA